jgi:hypothetical protein
MAMIDTEKTKKAYDFLAETQAGHKALQGLRTALDALQAGIQPQLNRGELLFVLRGLLAGLNVDEDMQHPAEVGGFGQQNIQGFVFQGQPGAVTRLQAGLTAPAFSRLTPGGFRIRADN